MFVPPRTIQEQLFISASYMPPALPMIVFGISQIRRSDALAARFTTKQGVR